MKRIHTVMALAVVGLLFLVPLVRSQDPMMVMEHKELGPHQRPLVDFNHDKHTATLECVRCHHDYDEHGNNRGGEDSAQSCSSCHHSKGSAANVPLLQAFHGQCKGCHDAMWARGRRSGPLMCGECHIRK